MLHIPLFDLHLNLYRKLKSDIETKVDFNVSLKTLHEKQLLKNPKYPFFNFQDNRNIGKLNNYDFYYDLQKKIQNNNYEKFIIYNEYLPRINIINILNSHPELENYYQNSKKGIYKMSNYNISELISGDNNLDWFIYDDESLNFLSAFEREQFITESNVKYIEDNGTKVIFEDRYKNVTLNEKQFTKLFINVTYIPPLNENNNNDNINKSITIKLKLNPNMTAKNIIERMNEKLSLLNNQFKFDPMKKILKVKSLNDYIIDINEKMIKYAYIHDCVYQNVEPDYIILDNPIKENNLENDENNKNSNSLIQDDENSIKKFFTSSNSKGKENSKEDFLKITSHLNNNNNNIQNDILDNFIDEISLSFKNKINENLNNDNKNNDDNKKQDLLYNESNLFSENSNLEQSMYDMNPHNFSRLTSFFLSDNSINISKKSTVKNNFLAPSFFNTSYIPRKKKSKNQQNIFSEFSKELPNISNMLEEKRKNINLKEIDRPFSIMVRNAYINKIYNSYPDQKKLTSVLVFKFQLFCGSQEFSNNPIIIKWINKRKSEKDYFDCHPCFNKRIYFDTNYNTLPIFCSLLIKVKLNVYDKQNHLISNNNIGWVNFKLFDHNKNLKTGTHKLNLLTSNFSDDSYFCYIDNNDYEEIENKEDKKKNKINNEPQKKKIIKSSTISFEIDSFVGRIFNEPLYISDPEINIDQLIISETDKLKIKEIILKTPFDPLNNYDKNVLWTNRYKLSQEPSILPKLLLCIDYKNPNHLFELEKILKKAKKLTPVQSLELLTGKYLHESIRNFAVICLKECTVHELQNYLIQLVQGLKFEMYHDNALARYLLELCVKYPLTIGHCFFWSLRSEMYNKRVQQRFGLYLEVFLSKISNNLLKIFREESSLVTDLNNIAKIPKEKSSEKLFKDALRNLNKKLIDNKMEVSLPLNFKFRIKGIVIEKSKAMKSKKKPLLLYFENADKHGENIIVLFKAGDDLRMDIVTLQLFKIMQTMWFNNDLNLKMSLYNVLSTDYYSGMLEIVKNSLTLAEIHKEEGGAFQSFRKNTLTKFFKKTGKEENEFSENFLLSTVAYCCSTFVLGIGDRHSDNIMLKKNGELFHIDFGHFLGHFKKKLGIKRERAPFVFTKQFQNVLGGDKGKKYLEFKNKLWSAYQILRKNSAVLITLLRILLVTEIPELDEKSIRYLEMTLCLNGSDEEAKKFLEDKLEESMNSWSVEFNFWIHLIANK